jgi:hypothetical protein
MDNNAAIMMARKVPLSDDVSFARAFPVSAIVHGSIFVILSINIK